MSNNTNLAKLARVIGTGTNSQVLTSQGGSSFSFADAAAGGASVTSSDTAPSSPSAGDLWFDSSTGELLVWYVDGSSNQWVGVSGTAGPAGADGSSVSSYANLASLPSSGNTHGDFAYTQDTKAAYMYLDTSWERMSVGPQIGPRLTTTPPATHSLNGDGSTSTITMAAIDESGFPITYDWDAVQGSTVYNAGSLPTALTAVAESNGVFTLTPSTNTSHATTTLKFRTKASDGVLFTPAISTLSLVFSSYFAATGGTVTTDGSYKVHKFTSSGTFSISTVGEGQSYAGKLDYLIVAGGGGGGFGANRGAGGGAGGLLTGSSTGITSGNMSIVVGTGGDAGPTGYAEFTGHGDNGLNSTFNSLTAIGGGGGGSGDYTNTTNRGQDGGSGGGDWAVSGGGRHPAGAGTSGQGYAGGGGGSSSPYGGGGGGAGGAGGRYNATGNGFGGVGVANSITGTSTYYAGGGSASGFDVNSEWAAGNGGGGIGHNVSRHDADAHGTDGLGGGGGAGGDGGNGVVIIRYRFQA